MKQSVFQSAFSGLSLADKEQEAIGFLRQNEPAEGYNVGFSGGKDSIVTLDLVRKAGVKHSAYYCCTTIDPPYMYGFIKRNYPKIQWNIPKKSFWELLLERNIPPTRTRRWCCQVLKEQQKGMVIVGVRAEESYRRANRPRIDVISKKHILFKPIFKWTEAEVWEYIDAHRLAYPKLYDEGFGRIGCVVCPMIFGRRSKRLELSMQTYPHIWQKFKDTEKIWFAKYRDGDFEKWWDNYVFGDFVDLSKIKYKKDA